MHLSPWIAVLTKFSLYLKCFSIWEERVYNPKEVGLILANFSSIFKTFIDTLKSSFFWIAFLIIKHIYETEINTLWFLKIIQMQSCNIIVWRSN